MTLSSNVCRQKLITELHRSLGLQHHFRLPDTHGYSGRFVLYALKTNAGRRAVSVTETHDRVDCASGAIWDKRSGAEKPRVVKCSYEPRYDLVQ